MHERRQLTAGQLSIGRGPHNDWILADPERHLSKQHCQVAFRAGSWLLEDFSANGTFLNRADTPVGAGSAQPLRNGDRIRLGAYEFEVTIEARGDEDAAWTDEQIGDFPGFDPRPVRRTDTGARKADISFAPDMLDQFPPAQAPGPFGAAPDPVLRGDRLLGDEGGAIRLPADYDPIGDEADPFHGPTQPDHAPAINSAFRPPPRPAAVIPDDWDADLPLQQPQAAEIPPRSEAPAPAPRTETRAPPARSETPAPPARPTVPREPIAAPSRPAAPPAASFSGSEVFAAFLRGAGLAEAVVADASAADAQQTMERAGAAFRAAVSGLRQVLIARAAIKGEFRIDQTMIQASGNNPLKFSADDDAALTHAAGTWPARHHSAGGGDQRSAARHAAARAGLDIGHADGGARAAGAIQSRCDRCAGRQGRARGAARPAQGARLGRSSRRCI